jgi:prefoldin subunit 5
MIMKQLEMFDVKRDIEKEFEDLKNQMEKVRKSLYARDSELRKMYQEIAHEQQILKLNICKGRM